MGRDGSPMVLGRYQWNLAGKSVGFSQPDVEYSESTEAAIGVAAVRGRGRHTRFDSGGGANLDGFTTAAPGHSTSCGSGWWTSSSCDTVSRRRVNII